MVVRSAYGYGRVSIQETDRLDAHNVELGLCNWVKMVNPIFALCFLRHVSTVELHVQACR